MNTIHTTTQTEFYPVMKRILVAGLIAIPVIVGYVYLKKEEALPDETGSLFDYEQTVNLPVENDGVLNELPGISSDINNIESIAIDSTGHPEAESNGSDSGDNGEVVLIEPSVIEDDAISSDFLLSNIMYDDNNLVELMDSLDSNTDGQRMIERQQYHDWLRAATDHAVSNLATNDGIYLDRLSCGERLCIARFNADNANSSSGALARAIDTVPTDMPVSALTFLVNDTNQGINVFIGTDPAIGVTIPETF